MAVLYIKEQGSMIQKRDEKIIVTKNSKTLLEIPVFSVENIAVIGNVQITSQALYLLIQSGVDINYFSYSGKYLGQTAADKSKNIFLRFSQYDLYKDEGRRLEIARVIISNKISNQICMIQNYRWGDVEYDWKNDISRMREMQEQLDDKKTSNEIMGVEGLCSNIYFGAFSQMVHGDFKFSGRNRRPPRDPVNALISLGYTFLTKEVSAALEAESFEMYLAFLHGIRYGRKSLALDMVEEFRQPVIDRFVLKVCNKRMINQFDFNEDGYEGVTMTEDGFKKFCQEYERWLTDGEINYRNRMKKQAQQLKQAIMMKKDYLPFQMGEGKDVSGKL